MSLTNQDLPVHNGNTMVSLLFLITSKSAEIYKNIDSNLNDSESWVIKVPLDAHVVAFSDRPHRVAKVIPEGIGGFINIFLKSDFTTDPPNVTVAGSLEDVLKVLSQVAKQLDPPRSPLKRGTLSPVPPFLRGARGDHRVVCITSNTF
jgi:hypothetical protein